MKIKPFGNNILVKPHEQDTILKATEGGLCEYGEVLEIGSDVKEIKVGDVLGFTVWGVNRLNIENEKFYFIPEDSRFVLGVVLP